MLFSSPSHRSSPRTSKDSTQQWNYAGVHVLSVLWVFREQPTDHEHSCQKALQGMAILCASKCNFVTNCVEANAYPQLWQEEQEYSRQV